jgi:hypothetical protein
VPCTRQQQRVIDKYLRTGDHDEVHDSPWPGENLFESMKAADAALREALVAEVKRREHNVRLPPSPPPDELVRMTRSRVEPMVRGLFPKNEQDQVLGLLEKSVVFLTPDNIEQVIQGQGFLHSAWTIANIYLASIGAELLGPDAPRILGMSEATTCYVSAEYLRGRDEFDDFIVHEAAHIFHNWKREYAGLPHTRRKEWLLEIDYPKRETFAHACEVYARILEQARKPPERLAMVEEYAEGPLPSEEHLDPPELVDILREAARAASIASMRMRPLTSPPFSPTCVACSAATRPLSSSSTTRARAPLTSVPVRPYAAAPSCTPGATATSTFVAFVTAIPSRSRSSTAPPPPQQD